MGFFSVEKMLSPTTGEAADVIRKNGGVSGIKTGGHIGSFFGNLGGVFRLIREEPEILLFALLQWGCITLAYMGWVQALDWIPDSVWEEVRRANDEDRDSGFALLNLFLIGWSFVMVVCVSFPLSVLSAGMVAVHALRHEGYESTFFYALWRGMRNVGQQWVFTIVDAWITVKAIFDRLPKKNNRRTIADEVLYYAWKLGTMGMVPAMVYGHGLLGAAKDSLVMVKRAPGRAIAIRFGYSSICWIVGIATYVAAMIYGCTMGLNSDSENFIYTFYFYMTVPIFISVGVISVLVRPFFLLMVAKLYTDVMQPKGLLDAAAAESSASTMDDTVPTWPVFFFAGAILFAVLTAIFMADGIGLTAWIERLAAEDFARIAELQDATP